MTFEGIVFDFDGTLGSSGISREILVSWCKKLQLDCQYYEIIEYLKTLPNNLREEKTTELLKLEHEQMANTDLYPGAMEWFEYIKKNKLKSAIFTRNTKANVEIVLKAKNIEVDMIMGRDCSIPKPHPDGLEIIVNTLKLNREKTLMVGDSLISDIQVGQAVGVKTLLVNFEGGRGEKDIIPDYRYPTLKEAFTDLCLKG